MKFISGVILAVVASMIFLLPKMAYAVDITMGSNGNLIFDPSDVTIDAGETIHFVNGMLPPHNIIVEGRADLSRESLMFSPGESQDILFADAGDYDFFCGPHQGAGMTGTIHVK
jgi:plastocyanin|tara:strand:+ start:877 stop:1218 length:342 start_codon:yes stop_codon:yes gene_type:complete